MWRLAQSRQTGYASVMGQIAKPLQPLAVPVAGLEGLPGNPRRGNIEAVKKSLDRFGQLKPIVYQLQNVEGKQKRVRVVIAGNHTLKAAIELGWEEIAAVDAAELSEDEARAFALADNRVSDLGTFDDEELRNYLRQASDTDPSLWEAASFSTDEINRLLATVSKDQFDGFLDDLVDGEAASWGGDMATPEILTNGLVPFQVMITADDRKRIMARLKELTDAGEYGSAGEALTGIVLGHE